LGTITVGALPKTPAGDGDGIGLKPPTMLIVRAFDVGVVTDVVVAPEGVEVEVVEALDVGMVATLGEPFEKTSTAEPASRATTIRLITTDRLVWEAFCCFFIASTLMARAAF